MQPVWVYSWPIVTMTVYLPFGFEFFPQSDQGQFSVIVRTPPGTSLLATDAVVKRVEEVVDQLPEMKTVKFKVSDSEWYNPASWNKSHSESQAGYCMAMTGSGSSGMMNAGDTGTQYANLSVKVVDKGSPQPQYTRDC